MTTSTHTTLRKFDWANILFLSLSPIVAIVLSIIYFRGSHFHWGQIGLFVFFYYATGMSITGGYHRLFSHRSFEAGPLAKLFFLLFGAAAFQNSALKWCTDHRIHHNHVDQEKDPYNINKGFLWAHIGWIFYKDNFDEGYLFPKDLSKDKLVMWQHRYYLPIAVVIGFILPTLLGGLLFDSYLGGFALSGLLRTVVVHHCTFFINSLCHVLGKRPYSHESTARDSSLMALFSYGEGFHNFHHTFPLDYRNGIAWYHYDPTKWMIVLFSWGGLTKSLRKVPKKMIRQAKEEMNVQNLQNLQSTTKRPMSTAI